jgi:hypothetical protein
MQSRPNFALGVQASGAIAFGRAVQVVASTTMGALGGTQATVAGQKIIGVAQRPAASGEWLDVIMEGTACCETGAAVAIGSRVMCDASGRAIPATALAVAAGATPVTSATANGATALTGCDTPSFAFGIALEAASGAGSFIEVLMK